MKKNFTRQFIQVTSGEVVTVSESDVVSSL